MDPVRIQSTNGLNGLKPKPSVILLSN